MPRRAGSGYKDGSREYERIVLAISRIVHGQSCFAKIRIGRSDTESDRTRLDGPPRREMQARERERERDRARVFKHAMENVTRIGKEPS